MTDFSFLSDTSDAASDAAVDDLLSQTRDLCILEQLSALNCASFSDSHLSADLESRFARLKSLPSAPTPAAAPSRPPPPESAPSLRRDSPDSAASHRARHRPPAASFRRDSPDSNPSPVSRRRSPASGSGGDSARREAEAEAGGCLFWCSPKKAEKKKKKKREVDWESDMGWSKSEELLEELGSYSIEEQRKILKKAMEEQRKISREARKIVKMGKQASLRTGVATPSVSSAELSDD